MQIYEVCGYTQRDAAKEIVSKNIFGLDIDKRAYQLAYFAIMMKARQYNRRIFNEHLKPNLFAVNDSACLTEDVIDYISKGDKKIKADLESIRNDLFDAKEYGTVCLQSRLVLLVCGTAWLLMKLRVLNLKIKMASR